MSASVLEFIETPSLDAFDNFRKDDLIAVADHFRISVSRQSLKKEIKAAVLNGLIALKILPESISDTSSEKSVPERAEGAGEVAGLVEADAEAEAKTGLPQFVPFSPATPMSKEDVNLKVRLERLRIEAEENAKIRRAEFDLKLEIRRLEIQAEKEIQLRRLELEEGKLSSESAGQAANPGLVGRDLAVGAMSSTFDVSKNISLVPLFRETEVDSYFAAFERIAISLNWPEEVWSLLLQCRLVGKAMEVFSTLPLEESMQYETVKTAILRAYELVPEAYRQKFRGHRKSSSQTFVEFAREKGVLFDKWCVSSQASDFVSLRELVLLEDFKKCLPERIVLYLNEQKVTKLSIAAVLADEFALTHKNVFGFVRSEKNGSAVVSLPTVTTKNKVEQSRERRECFYCHKTGHVIADCMILKRKNNSTAKMQPVGLIKTASVHVDSVYEPFLLKGFVSFSDQSDDGVAVRVLRDTGAARSFIRGDVLPFSQESCLDSSILVQGISMEVLKVPLHRVYLQTELVAGFVDVGVRPMLPVPGVEFILGNDLAGGRVLPVLEVLDKPVITSVSDELTQMFPEVFPACVLTRAQTKRMGTNFTLDDTFMCADEVTAKDENVGTEELVCRESNQKQVSEFHSLTLSQPVNRKCLIKAQRNDVTLTKCFEAVSKRKGDAVYFITDGLLMRKWKPRVADDECFTVCQIVVPTDYRSHVLSLAHDHVMAGHLGVTKTYNRVLRHFFWPRLKTDVAAYCRSCPICQIVGKPNQVIPPAPLIPIPALGEPFEHVVVDCVGPLPKTKTGNQFLLTVMCMATRYPEAIPLRKITSKAVMKVLVKFFSTFGLPKIVQTDQGTNFMSKVFTQTLQTLGISHRTSSPYHPESQGGLERFHQTLKSMLKKYCWESGNEWDEGVPFVLFAAREITQESLRFSPAELVFGHSVRGPLKVFKEQMLGLAENLSPTRNVLAYVTHFRDRVQTACAHAKEELSKTQYSMKQRYDQETIPRSFSAGDQVLVLLPIPGSALSARFAGPYEVVSKRSETDYVIKTPDRKRKTRVCHINMLKAYHSRETIPLCDSGNSTEPVVSSVAVSSVTVPSSPVNMDVDMDVKLQVDPVLVTRLSNSEMLADLPKLLCHLTNEQQCDLVSLIQSFPQIFGDVPKQTDVLYHDIDVQNAVPIKQHPYRVNATKRAIMKKEVEYLLHEGLAEPSVSPWSSPCLLVPKADGSVRFCTDYRKINSVTVPDCFPLPRMEDCIDNVGSAEFVSKLDMLKGYWQVPLTQRASEISAFVTPDSFLQYRVMAFGLRNAPATFQRLVNTVLAGVPNCSAYLDDLVVYSSTWSEHLSTLAIVFQRLANASLTLNLAKCDFCKATVTYLGKQVGGGQVRPVEEKVSAIKEFPAPTTRRELRRFLGMAGYYRSFCRNFSSIVKPLTDLLSPAREFVWSDESQYAFEIIKHLLCSSPVLSAPNFSAPFKLEVDASAVGAGAVLLQEDEEGIDHPICFFSKKFSKYQLNYSTIEKEALALLLSLQHFEVYVGSTPYQVVVYTDHNPLTFLHRMYNQNQRLMRWALIVQNYNLEIRHKKGMDNVVADALSRV